MSKKVKRKVSNPPPKNQSIGLDIMRICPTPKGAEQEAYLQSIEKNTITFVIGPPGSGKTWMPTLYGLFHLLQDKYKKMIISRPCVEANGERLGFLKGDLAEKLSNWMTPLTDIMEDNMKADDLLELFNEGKIKMVSLGLIRGLTFKNSFVIVDEAQNMTSEQMRLLLTRLGNKTKIVITGDLNQSDIFGTNGLADAVKRFAGMEQVGIVQLTAKSIVRSPLIAEIEERYSKKIGEPLEKDKI
jgi:phosphate starvation-inducible protein PhoH and related proteins